MATPDPILTSASNPLIQFARQVRDGKQKDFLLIEGDRLLSDAIQAGLQWHQSFHSTQPSPRQQQLLSALHQLQCPTRPVSEKLLQSLSATVHSQNLIAIAHKPNLQPTAFWSRIQQQKSPALLVVLDQVQDPGNVGTIIRTAEAAGCHGVISLQGSADPFSSKALRSAMGSAFRLPILHGMDPATAMQQLHREGIQTLAAATHNALPYRQHSYQPPSALILGNEGNGLSPERLSQCQTHITIPIAPSVESLNVASAAAIILFEAAAQRSQHHP